MLHQPTLSLHLLQLPYLKESDFLILKLFYVSECSLCILARMPARAAVASLQHLASSSLCNTVLEVFHALHTQVPPTTLLTFQSFFSFSTPPLQEASVSSWAPSLHSLLSLHLQQSLYQAPLTLTRHQYDHILEGIATFLANPFTQTRKACRSWWRRCW